MSLLGISFGFGSRDVGMRAGMANAERSMGRLNGLMSQQDRISRSSNVGTFFRGLAHAGLGDTINQIRQIADQQSNLSNSLEDWAVASEQTIAPMVARLGLVGDEARSATGEIMGLGRSMNVDVGTVGQSFVALQETGDEARATLEGMGIGLRQLVQIQQVTGMESEQFISTIQDLNTSWGLSSDQAGELLNTLTALGQEAGVGSAMFSHMTEITNAMDTSLAGSNIERTPESIMATQESIVRLAGAFRQMGNTADESLTNATTVFTTLAENSQQYENMFNGMDSEFGDLMGTLARTEGIDISADLMRNNPLEFVQNMNRAVTRLADNDGASQQLGYLVNQLSLANPQMRYLATGGEHAAQILQQMADVAPVTTNALVDLGEAGSRTGYTLADSARMARENFETHFRAIARGPVRDFVRSQNRAYREMGTYLTDLSEDPAWGGIVHRISAIQQLGVRGFFINMDDDNQNVSRLATTIDFLMSTTLELLNTMAPAMQAIDGIAESFKLLGGVLGGLSGPLVILGALGAGLYLIVKYPQAVSDTFDAIKVSITGFSNSVMTYLDGLNPEVLADKVFGFFSTGFKMVADWIKGILVRRFVRDASSGLTGMFGALGDVAENSGADSFTGGLGRMFGKVWEFVSGFVGRFADAFVKWFREVDWGNVVTRIVDFMARGWERMINLVGRIVEIVAGLPWGEIVDGIGSALMRVLPGLVGAFTTVIQGVVGLIGQVLPLLVSAFVDVIPSIVNGLVSAIPGLIDAIIGIIPSLADAFVTIVGAIGGILNSVMPQIVDVFVEVFPEIIDSIIGLIPVLVQTFVDVIPSIVNGLVSAIPQVVQTVVDVIPVLIGGITDAMPALIEGGIQIIVGLSEGLMRSFPILVDSLVESLPLLINSIIRAMPELIGVMSEVFRNSGRVIMEGIVKLVVALVPPLLELAIWTIAAIGAPLLEGIVGIAEGLWDGLVDVLSPLSDWFYDNVLAPFMGGWDRLSADFNNTINSIKTWFDDLTTWVSNGIESVVSGISGFVSGIVNDIVGFFDAPKELLASMIDTYNDLMSALGGETIVNPYRTVVEGPLATGGAVQGDPVEMRNMGARMGVIARDALNNALVGDPTYLENSLGAYVGGSLTNLQGVINAYGTDAGRAFYQTMSMGMEESGGELTDSERYVLKQMMALLPQSPPEDQSSPLAELPLAGVGVTTQLMEGFSTGMPVFSTTISTLMYDAGLAATASFVSGAMLGTDEMLVDLPNRISSLLGGTLESNVLQTALTGTTDINQNVVNTAELINNSSMSLLIATIMLTAERTNQHLSAIEGSVGRIDVNTRRETTSRNANAGTVGTALPGE